MLASKFLLDGLYSSFAAADASHPWAQRAALLQDTAMRVYWLDRPPRLQRFA
jgi:hypothetical protein